jgi:hypothetical protein
MRTIEELKQLLNPNGDPNGKWTHVPVEKEVNGQKYIELHEVFFDDLGDFIGITKNPVQLSGYNIDDLKSGLVLMLKSCNNTPVITNEEKELIFNS